MGESQAGPVLVAGLVILGTLAGASGVAGPGRSDMLLALGALVALALSRHPRPRLK